MTNPPRVAVFPGSFDPITLGHEDVIRRALSFADRVIVAVAHRSTQSKHALFPISERLEMIEEVFSDEPRVVAAEFEGLLVDFARARGARLVIRGLRTVTDFEYELQMAQMNRALHPEIETIFLAADASLGFVSSSLVREIFGLGGSVEDFVAPPVRSRLREMERTG
ncbi:MAG TPA: pantetheine-phosphate adenylyltransferase [Longimicrobiaceae bacterium]|nr:pantetheine-phosphate adenylyltransferase [Longimicrobiaceae bacterium]